MFRKTSLFTTYKEDIFLNLVKCCRRVYSAAVKLEISMLQQRAKLRWLKHGDQSSKVFFRKINSTRVKQRVFQITTASGELLATQHDVTQEFISYFQNLLGGSTTHRMLDLGFLRPELKHTITTAEASLLVAPVTQSEVKDAFFDIDVESAPGSDGFTSAFYRAAWPIVGQSMFESVGEFFRTDYRPISCCNVLYKAITKIIVKRIQRVLPLLINYSQNAFVPGRSISDNILLAQELLAGYNQTRLPERCTLKVDIQKAYDSVEWDLLEVLKLFDFPHQFITLIEQCISTASFSVSLNGSIHGFFKGGRGLRQDDPMSPYLFVLVMEIWNSLLRHRVHNAAHFQYHWKCKEHGLKVNPAKSQIILSRAVQQQHQQILELLGFQEGSLPIKYLGVLKNLEMKMRTFLWQGQSGRGNAKVAWAQICKSKAEGGLGISSLITTNQALILKQLWRILQNDRTSIWWIGFRNTGFDIQRFGHSIVQRVRGVGRKCLN
ncbi:hypothetical protein Sango_2889200 [Sesamum angolense]|uniref:Reverse transcriptase domain-containing protein n=1 Tax=Sesamum angolense TaxID=2727404 RepID=A0AAE1VV63_9LAMI|nr:hypothetical protein Sango_2889200 [Sesamum angolense]